MKLKCLHHVRFIAKDLDELEIFAGEFGLITESRTENTLVMRTCGGDIASYIAVKGDEDVFAGFALEADDTASLDEAVEKFGATEVDASTIPGVKRAVSMTDPDGITVTLVHGVTRRAPEEPDEDLILNTPFKKERLGRQQVRRAYGPGRLWRLGHVALFVKSYAVAAAWYKERLGIIASDVYHIPGMPQAQIVGFHRLDRGEEYTDHHTIAFMQDENRQTVHHISFEVQDFEAQNRTHRYLNDKDYESIWGVGRHPEGSHIFDVWRSPDGARFETFSDTDQFRASDGTNIHDISHSDMDVWSSEGPEKYFI